MRHIHLDPVGGVAGDMFVAALVDAFPEYRPEVVRAAELVSGVPCVVVGGRNHVISGTRFRVEAGVGPGFDQHHVERDSHRHHPHDDGHRHDHAHGSPALGLGSAGDGSAGLGSREDGSAGQGATEHGATGHGAVGRQRDEAEHHHTEWQEIRRRLEAADLPEEAIRHAVGIFQQLADAEAEVHGIAPEAVAFHEVGAADSIADIVAAGWLIAALGESSWSVGPLPLGGGRVRTQHGLMPVPAPATALLMRGFQTIDDGVPGERVTPTGAAILRYLGCASGVGDAPRRLARSGHGLGIRVLPGMSNCLRVLVFEAQAGGGGAGHRELSVISFEVDDQSAEDLAAGLARLRALEGVHDVLQMPAFGKKGRMTAHVQVLVRPSALQAATEACFRETTTIGLRTHLVQGLALPRRAAEVSVGGQRVRVKLVERPGGVVTAKAEADDVMTASQAERVRLRQEAEATARADDAGRG